MLLKDYLIKFNLSELVNQISSWYKGDELLNLLLPKGLALKDVVEIADLIRFKDEIKTQKKLVIRHQFII